MTRTGNKPLQHYCSVFVCFFVCFFCFILSWKCPSTPENAYNVWYICRKKHTTNVMHQWEKVKTMPYLCRYQRLYSQLPDIRESIAFVENYLNDFDLSTAFSHNDFCGNNIIYDEESGQYIHMMMSSNGNIFRVTGHLCGDFTGSRWIPHTKASDAELWCFLNDWVNNREAGDLRRYRAHYDVIVMFLFLAIVVRNPTRRLQRNWRVDEPPTSLVHSLSNGCNAIYICCNIILLSAVTDTSV